MINISAIIADELNLQLTNVENALTLIQEGATIPFIARYRKERTGEMNEIQLRDVSDRFIYLTELEERKRSILKSIKEQGKLTPELEQKIRNTLAKTELEDFYLPYKPKRRTRATIAKEKGLQPLADELNSANEKKVMEINLLDLASKYVNTELGVNSVNEALQGASDILAETIADRADLRQEIREYLLTEGQFSSQIKADFPEGTTKYEMYRKYTAKVSQIPAHNLLAIFRGEAEKILDVDLLFDTEYVLTMIASKIKITKQAELRKFYQETIADAFNRLIKTSLINEVRSECKLTADLHSISTFEANLRELLLSAPAGMKPTLAIDPGFRTGCKVAVLSETGKFLEYQAIFPHQSTKQRQEATNTIINLARKYQIQLIAIGNGTASRETEQFINELMPQLDPKPIKVIVNESGASIYSASDVAISEFPDLDITVRGAISIGRRLQDPLAELVKIDPKSIGVGQYQHDVDQKLLKKKLDDTVESCVNYVGVDLNTASKELLTFVSGLTPTVANNIVAYRNEHGAFKNRKQLLKVTKLGPKAFEQCAGFLRIRDGENPLDNTAVHPESYHIVAAIAQDLQVNLSDINTISPKLYTLNLKKYITEEIGEPTLRDIIAELAKPGRDPRAQFTYANFKEGINEITDLQVGMELEGIITNVANFGAFVDIGVHQDGLVHISQLADRFIKDPQEIVKVGQIVKVKVIEVNTQLKRIGLSMKNNPTSPNSVTMKKSHSPTNKNSATIDDLRRKFSK